MLPTPAFSKWRRSSLNSPETRQPRTGSCFSVIALSSCRDLTTNSARICADHYGFWSRSPERCFFLLVPTWEICCWRVPQRVSGNSPFAWPSAPAGRASSASCWWKACSWRGAILGLALAFLADRILLRVYLPPDAAAEFVVSPIPDGRVLAFVVGVMLLTALVFGLLPAVRGSRTEISLSLKDRSGALSAGGISLRRMLVGIQVALSLLLLVGAGLFVRTLRNLRGVGPGFPTDHLLTFTINPSLNGYSDEVTRSFYERLNVDLQTMPGVASVGFSTMPLLKGYAWQNAVLGKDFEGVPIEEQPVLNYVGPDYFATLGIPIVAGRAFTAQDVRPNKCAVINESFAWIRPGCRCFAGACPRQSDPQPTLWIEPARSIDVHWLGNCSCVGCRRCRIFTRLARKRCGSNNRTTAGTNGSRFAMALPRKHFSCCQIRQSTHRCRLLLKSRPKEVV